MSSPLIQFHTGRHGRGLKTAHRITAGQEALRELPFLLSPVPLPACYARYLELTEDEIIFLGTLDANTYALSEADDKEIAKLLGPNSPHLEGFRWFLALMKCNAHGLSHGLSLWAIYKNASRVNHSCDPNVAYRNEDGLLVYVALRDVEAGEEILVSYITGLFGSTPYRRHKLLQQKLFVCECSRCTLELDATRRVWCPHCRTKTQSDPNDAMADVAFATCVGKATGLQNLPQFQMTKQMNAKSNGGEEGTEEWWMCTGCKMAYSSSVLPVAVESTLVNLFSRLDSALASPDSDTWMQYLTYLYRTTLTVLGPMHWLVGTCHFLYSRFYTGVWNGGGKVLQARDLALQHGQSFFEFVEATAKQALASDVLPWASVMLRLALEGAEVGAFCKIAAKHLNGLRNLYGQSDPTVRAYEEAVQFIHTRMNQVDSNTLTQTLASFAHQSQRPLLCLRTVTSRLPSSQIKWTKAIDSHDLNLASAEKKASRRRNRPWEVKRDVPRIFLDAAVLSQKRNEEAACHTHKHRREHRSSRKTDTSRREPLPSSSAPIPRQPSPPSSPVPRTVSPNVSALARAASLNAHRSPMVVTSSARVSASTYASLSRPAKQATSQAPPQGLLKQRDHRAATEHRSPERRSHEHKSHKKKDIDTLIAKAIAKEKSRMDDLDPKQDQQLFQAVAARVYRKLEGRS